MARSLILSDNQFHIAGPATEKACPSAALHSSEVQLEENPQCPVWVFSQLDCQTVQRAADSSKEGSSRCRNVDIIL